jgi:hypothetical protein
MSFAILKVWDGKVYLQVADESVGQVRQISSNACIQLGQSEGKSIVVRDHVATDNDKGWEPRAAMVGNYDRKGKLTLAIGHVGKPITGNDDIASKEIYLIDPVLYESFCRVFDSTQRDADAVQSLAKKAKKNAVVEVAVTL